MRDFVDKKQITKSLSNLELEVNNLGIKSFMDYDVSYLILRDEQIERVKTETQQIRQAIKEIDPNNIISEKDQFKMY